MIVGGIQCWKDRGTELIFGRSNCFGWLKLCLRPINGLPHGHCVPRSLLTTELQFLREELPAAMLQTDEQRDVVLARAPLVDLTVRLAKPHPELEANALQALSGTPSNSFLIRLRSVVRNWIT